MNIEIGVITDEITIAIDETLHLYSKILKFDAPASRTVKGIQDWLERRRLQDEYGLMNPRDDRPYVDLISLHSPVEEDLLSRSAATWLKLFFLDVQHPFP